jgi:hypothetical protein
MEDLQLFVRPLNGDSRKSGLVVFVRMLLLVRMMLVRMMLVRMMLVRMMLVRMMLLVRLVLVPLSPLLRTYL